MEFNLDQAVEKIFATLPPDEISRRAKSIVAAWESTLAAVQLEDREPDELDLRIMAILEGRRPSHIVRQIDPNFLPPFLEQSPVF